MQNIIQKYQINHKIIKIHKNPRKAQKDLKFGGIKFYWTILSTNLFSIF